MWPGERSHLARLPVWRGALLGYHPCPVQENKQTNKHVTLENRDRVMVI